MTEAKEFNSVINDKEKDNRMKFEFPVAEFFQLFKDLTERSGSKAIVVIIYLMTVGILSAYDKAELYPTLAMSAVVIIFCIIRLIQDLKVRNLEEK